MWYIYFMDSKRRALLVALGGVAVIGVFLIALRLTGPKAEPSTSNVPSVNNENKVYTVKEVVSLLKTNPNSLKGKSIQLEAYVVDAVDGLDCSDFQIMTDKEYVEAFNNRYNNELSESERSKAVEESKAAPVLLTGRTMAMPGGFNPTYHAIFQGHFYDKWTTETCGVEGYRRFVIEKL